MTGDRVVRAATAIDKITAQRRMRGVKRPGDDIDAFRAAIDAAKRELRGFDRSFGLSSKRAGPASELFRIVTMGKAARLMLRENDATLVARVAIGIEADKHARHVAACRAAGIDPGGAQWIPTYLETMRHVVYHAALAGDAARTRSAFPASRTARESYFYGSVLPRLIRGALGVDALPRGDAVGIILAMRAAIGLPVVSPYAVTRAVARANAERRKGDI